MATPIGGGQQQGQWQQNQWQPNQWQQGGGWKGKGKGKNWNSGGKGWGGSNHRPEVTVNLVVPDQHQAQQSSNMMQGLIPNLVGGNWSQPTAATFAPQPAHCHLGNPTWPWISPTPGFSAMLPMTTMCNPAPIGMPMPPGQQYSLPANGQMAYQQQTGQAHTPTQSQEQDLTALISQLATRLQDPKPPAPTPPSTPPSGNTGGGALAKVLQAITGLGQRPQKQGRPAEDSDEEPTTSSRRKRRDLNSEKDSRASDIQMLFQQQQEILQQLKRPMPMESATSGPFATPDRNQIGRNPMQNTTPTSRTSSPTQIPGPMDVITPDLQSAFMRALGLKGQPTLSPLSTTSFIASTAKVASLLEWQELHATFVGEAPPTKAMCIKNLLNYVITTEGN